MPEKVDLKRSVEGFRAKRGEFEVLRLPQLRYLMIDGSGDPNTAPEYAEALHGVEVDGLSLKDFAAAAGITPNNAAVRVHRAREALRRRLVATCATCAARGCVDCTCGTRGEAS